VPGVAPDPAADPLPEADPLAPLLESQHGAISRQQALACGLSDEAVEARLDHHEWQRVHQGVFVAFSGPPPRLTQIYAALLRAGPGATVSHWTAAELDGLADDESEGIHITVPTHRRIEPIEGVIVHYATRLKHTRHPMLNPPRTRVEETVLDLVDVAKTVDEVLRWVTRACQRRRTTAGRLSEALGKRKKIRWRAELNAVLVDVGDGAQSVLEVLYRRRVERAHGLPPGRRQRPPVSGPGRAVDVEYEDYRTRVELDGRIGHVEEGAFRDMDRDNATTVDGLDGLRYGWVHVFGQPCAAAAQVARVLNANGWRGRPRRCGPGCQLPPPS
jgi:hypothetical protein